jgi:GNAT superfamily N-acetyltransferase
MTLFFTIRSAASHDAALIAQQRKLMFAEQKQFSQADLAHMQGLYEAWVTSKLACGDYHGWFAETANGEVIGGVGLWLREWPPILNNYTGKQGYIENVFTLPVYRRKGVARKLMMALLDWVKTSKAVYEIELHPTQMAHSLYSSLGFESNHAVMSQWLGPKHDSKK